MSLFRRWYPALIILFITACNPHQKQMEKVLAGKSFAGITPCADCEGIAYRISFYANSNYESSSMYIGESNKKFIEKGSWSAERDSIVVLRSEEGNRKWVRVEDDQLRMLDMKGNEVEGELAGMYVLRDMDAQPVEGKLQPGDLAGSPVDFKAHGNEPFWGLQIVMDSLLSFKVISGDSLGAAVTDIQTDSADGVQTISTDPDSGSLEVELHPVGCMDGMSGQVYDYRVLVRYKGTEYSGCGGFLNS